ncbi:MAG: hypothetical protein WAP35_10035 [Solirubrobacterales bacterium]
MDEPQGAAAAPASSRLLSDHNVSSLELSFDLVFVLAFKTIGHVDDPLKLIPAIARCGGPAIYLTALSAIKRRNIGSFNYQRLLVATLLAVLILPATELPALATLADRHSRDGRPNCVRSDTTRRGACALQATARNPFFRLVPDFALSGQVKLHQLFL